MKVANTLLVTGGAGFIGSNAILHVARNTDWHIVNVDSLAYSGNPASLASLANNPRYSFVKADIADAEAMRNVFEKFDPDAVMHLAAESHVDRSIDSPETFIDTNIKGTFTLLEAARAHFKKLKKDKPWRADNFRFLHISTDEVFGDLGNESGDETRFFNETTPYAPSSPYSASKAASDHLVRAWMRTYGLPTLVTNCSNNYGPRQFPEKLIPLMIINAIHGRPLPVYGQGLQIRDWLYVEDHVKALLLALSRGTPGATYTVGGHCEMRNIDVVGAICAALEELAPQKPEGIGRYSDLISFVEDRPGHDARYAIDPTLITNELGWKPAENFASGIRKTVAWYLENRGWWQPILDGTYQGQRLGVNI